MTFEPNYEKLVSGNRKNLGTTQAVVEIRLPSESDGKIVSILCANANAFIASSEIVGKELTFVGYAGFQVVYLCEANETHALDYTAEFKDRHMLSVEQNFVTPALRCEVVDVQTEASDDSVKMTAIVEISIDVIENSNTNALVSVTGNDTFSRRESINYYTFNSVASEKFDIAREFDIKDVVEKILTVSPSVAIESVQLCKGYVRVRGDANIVICYTTDGEQNLPRTVSFNFDFEHEVAGNAIDENSVIQSEMFVWTNDLKITTALDVNNAIVSLNIPVMFKGYVFTPVEMDVVTDVFNARNHLLINYESVNILNTYPSNSFTHKISGSATVDESMPFMDEVLGHCCGGIVVASQSVTDGRLLVEGVSNTTVLYFNKENNAIVSYDVEMPFSVMLGDGLPDELIPIVSASLSDISAKGKRGKEIEVSASLNVFADYYFNTTDVVVSNVAQQGEKEADDLVLCIYIVKDGDTIWDVAKETSFSPDIILEQNPDLELPLKAGDRVIIYKQREAQF